MLLVSALAAAVASATNGAAGAASTSQDDVITFPPDFAFGTATAAYQIEGGWQDGGRGMSIWDAFSHLPGKIKTGETGDVASDHYNRWQSDVRLMAQMKLRYCTMPCTSAGAAHVGAAHVGAAHVAHLAACTRLACSAR